MARVIIIGTYEIGYERAELRLDPDDRGGCYDQNPDKGKPFIKVGGDYLKWREVLAILIHEAFEWTMARLRCRYEVCQDMGQDHSGLLFVLTHNDFSDACGRTAEFVAMSQTDLHKAWRSNRKKK